jgi:hypothetical protein
MPTNKWPHKEQDRPVRKSASSMPRSLGGPKKRKQNTPELLDAAEQAWDDLFELVRGSDLEPPHAAGTSPWPHLVLGEGYFRFPSEPGTKTRD